MRLIDADALKGDYVVTSTTTNSLCNLYVSMEQIAMAPTVKLASPWHRVEEPPKENGRYFVSWEGAVATDEYKNGVWLYASILHQRVTYWMPIPEPPKEENK